MAAPTSNSLEERLRAIEDRLEIMNLIAGYTPSADSAAADNATEFWTEDATLDMGRGVVSFRGMMDTLASDAFRQAQAQGIGHFTSPPHITIDGEAAVATSYLQILAADADGKPFELAAHGTSKGFRVWRHTVNRWELTRTPKGWRIKHRTIRALDNPEVRGLLRRATAGGGSAAAD